MLPRHLLVDFGHLTSSDLVRSHPVVAALLARARKHVASQELHILASTSRKHMLTPTRLH